MRKLFSLTMVLMVVAGLVLSACQAPAAAPTTPAPVQPAATDVPAQPVEKAFRVGLVTDVGKVDDKSFNQSAWEGAQMAEKELGAEIKYIETTDPKDYEKNISTFADEGYDVIVTVGFALGEATQAAAKKYPNVKFIGVDQFQAETVPGVAGLNFPEDQAGFMAGALAALMSKSGQIGAVLGTDAVPPVWRFGEGYKAGALYANPDIKLNVVYHNDVGFDKTFVDPEWGKTTALSMIDKGADVIFGAGGKTGNGALLGGVEKGIPVIGVDTDQYLTVPEAQSVLLTSAMKLIVPGTFELIKAAKEGNWQDGNVYGKAALAPYHDWDSKVPADVKAKVDEITTKLQAGELKTDVPPAKPADQPTEVKKLKVGLVTDVGKVDDKSFNQSAWEGAQMAEKELGAEI
jgi:basic membrane protein A